MLLSSDSGDKPNFGTVVAVGEGKKAEDGAQVKPNVDVGATVMYSKYSGTEYEVRRVGGCASAKSKAELACGGLGVESAPAGASMAGRSHNSVSFIWMCASGDSVSRQQAGDRQLHVSSSSSSAAPLLFMARQAAAVLVLRLPGVQHC